MSTPQNRITPVFPKPLVCIEGEDRPPLIPEFIGNKAICGIQQAKEGILAALDGYSACKKEGYGYAVSIDSKKHPLFSLPAKWLCGSLDNAVADTGAKKSIPILLRNLELIDLPHRFFEIVYRLNADQIHDFRSVKIFSKVADLMGIELKKNRIRFFTATYPGSGSHLTPLLIALKLIDKNIIDRASFLFTEVDENSLIRIEDYLRASGHLFSDFKISNKQIKPGESGYEITYSWKYKGKPIEITVGVNKSKAFDYFSPHRYYYSPHLTIIHDLSRSNRNEGMMGELVSIRKDRSEVDFKQPAWVLMEPPLEKEEVISLTSKSVENKKEAPYSLKELEIYFSSQLPSKGLSESSRLKLQDLANLQGYYLFGLYGCEADGLIVNRPDHNYSKIWGVENGKLTSSKIEKGDPYTEGTATIPVRTPNGLMRGQMEVTHHLNQSRAGALLIRLPKSVSYEDSSKMKGNHQKSSYSY